jgi:hypothetical protein
MYYIFYRTINLINGKSYYGAHKTKNLIDGYLGSGTAIKKAIAKYGKSSFVREIIKFFDSEKEMYEYEKSFINESVVSSNMTYNQTLGGIGGFSHIDLRGDKNPMKRKETITKLVKNRTLNGSYKTEKCIKHQKNMTIAAKKKNIGKKRPEHSKFMSEWSAKNWKENKEKLRDILSSKFIVRSPNGGSWDTNRLKDFCKVNNLPYVSVWNSSVTGKAVTKGKAKGWICTKVN